jgi:hypothetical protein
LARTLSDRSRRGLPSPHAGAPRSRRPSANHTNPPETTLGERREAEGALFRLSPGGKETTAVVSRRIRDEQRRDQQCRRASRLNGAVPTSVSPLSTSLRGTLHKSDRSLRLRRHGRGQWGQGPRARRIGVRNKTRRTWGREVVRVRHLPGRRRRRRDVGGQLARERAHVHYFIFAIKMGAVCSGRRPNMEQLTHNIWHAYPILLLASPQAETASRSRRADDS